MKILKPIWVIAFTSTAFLLASESRAADWPHFRGPNYDGASADTVWASGWGQDGPTVAWRRALGPGASSVVVVGSRALTMANQADQDTIHCLDVATGKDLWTYSYPCPLSKRQFEGGPAATPTISDGRVYTLSHHGKVHCLELDDGSVVWSVDVVAEHAGQPPRWQYAGSPLVINGAVIVDIGGAVNSSLALDAKTGKKLWGAGDEPAGYAPPLPTGDGKTILFFKGTSLIARTAADGTALWSVPWKTSYDVNASSPVVEGDRVLVSSGYGTGRAALFDISGTAPRELWLNKKMKTKMSSCVVYKGHVYGVSGAGGALVCINVDSGETVWTENGMSRDGSVALAGDRLVVLTDKGELIVAAASSAGYREIGRAEAVPERSWVTPVIANGRVYCKDNSGNLVCYEAN